MPLRVLRSEAALALADPEGGDKDDLAASGYLDPDGRASTSIMPAGQAAGLIERIDTAAELISDLTGQSRDVSTRLFSFFNRESS